MSEGEEIWVDTDQVVAVKTNCASELDLEVFAKDFSRLEARIFKNLEKIWTAEATFDIYYVREALELLEKFINEHIDAKVRIRLGDNIPVGFELITDEGDFCTVVIAPLRKKARKDV